MNSAVRRTLVMYVACLLGALPLLSVVDDIGWLFDAYLAMAAVLLPALLLRLRRPPGALQIWPGIALLALLLTARYLPDHAILGVLPGRGTWHDLWNLLDDLHNSMRTQTAPVHSTPSMRFALSLLLALVTALVDLLAVVGRHGALAGLPLLVVFTASGAMVRGSVPWPVFVLAGIGFLLLLSLDAPDDADSWGHRIVRADQRRTGSSTALTAVRIGAVALVVALIGALLVPVRGHNLVADAIRHTGSGGGSGTSVDPFAGLAGDLRRGSPIDLATVTIAKTGGPDAQPFYLRTNVLETVTADGWVQADPRFTVPVHDQRFPLFPDSAQLSVPRLSFVATINTDRLSGPPPVFAYPTQVAGLSGDVQWSPDEQTLIGKVKKKQTYVVTAEQPVPTVGELGAVPIDDATGDVVTAPLPDGAEQWLQVPHQPSAVWQTLQKITDSLPRYRPSTAYEKARAISEYFTDPANGFAYSLATVKGDSGNDLVDFLTYKKGFCQQYAAAMGVLLRMAGVPSRVVIGFSHPVPDSTGTFTISSSDAHAWVEAYIAGSGWVPFDPTPLAGISGGAANDLPWAPHPTQSGPTVRPTGSAANETEPNPHQNQARSPSADATPTATPTPVPWGWIGTAAGLLILLAVLAVPWLVRSVRTRRRMRAARAGDSEALWAELADTATDLGYVWSPARTPRQVADWLSGPAGTSEPALLTLARTVEQARYAPLHDASADGIAELAQVRQALRGRLPWRERLRTRLLPASVLPRLRARKRH